MSKQTRKYHYDFRGAVEIPTVADGGPFVKTNTAAIGSPTVGGIAGGGLRLQLDATSEVQNLAISMGDVLPFSMADLISVEIIARTVAALDAATQIAFGLSAARNDSIDSITEMSLFRCIGSNDVVVESDDGTNNHDDVATGLTLGATWKRFAIDFAERTSTMEPPSVSKGRGSNIGFYGANDHGSHRRVGSGTRFDMSNYSGGLQLMAQIQKTTGVNTDYLDIMEMSVEVNLPSYA